VPATPAAPQIAPGSLPPKPPWAGESHALQNGKIVYRDPTQGGHWFYADRTPYEAAQ
jgi:hypothetical protein